MDKKTEALKLALESLKELVADPETDFGPAYAGAEQRQKKAITAIREALTEQPAKQWLGLDADCIASVVANRTAHSQPAQQQEPVAWPADMLERIDAAVQRITSGQGCMRVPPDKTDPDLVLAEIRKLIKSSPPASKPLVGLTEEEWFQWWQTTTVLDNTEAEIDFADFLLIARASEAKLKEKNT